MEKSKVGYTMGSNILYSLSTYWKIRKLTVIMCAVGIIMRVALPFAGILMPKLVVDELVTQASIPHFITVVGGMGIILVLLNFIKSYTDQYIDEAFGTIGSYHFAVKFGEKLMTMDYELFEDPDRKALSDKASRAGENNHTQAMNLPRNLSSLIVNILGLILYGSVILLVHPIILLLLVLSAVINWLVLSAARKYEIKTRDERSKKGRKIGYLTDSMKTPAFAKDIRLYTMFEWLYDLSLMLISDKEQAEGKVAKRNMFAQLTDGFLILIRDGAAYAFLISLLINNRIALGDFVLIFAAIGTLAAWVSGVILHTSEFSRANSEMTDLRSFYDAPDISNTGVGKPLPSGKQLPPGITLTNVGYTYPNAEKAALKDINIDIKPGERIAIVGVNGAGKTTLVKLVCGLYKPKTGTIRLNGTDICEFNRDEYFTLFSTVFQDIHLMTNGIAGNIAQKPPENIDADRIPKCIKLSGLYEKVESLPNKENTKIVRQTDEDAIELSGGEKQKLVFARALYKDAPVIILDEPTAALDPIAENEMYQKYAELTYGKTSIYISHRLASTRFCDRILLIDNQTVEEEGTHDELMRFGGKYAHMFNIQSSYYTKGREVRANV